MGAYLSIEYSCYLISEVTLDIAVINFPVELMDREVNLEGGFTLVNCY